MSENSILVSGDITLHEALHGFAAYELFGRGIGNWLVHAVIMIGLFRLQPAALAINPGGSGP